MNKLKSFLVAAFAVVGISFTSEAATVARFVDWVEFTPVNDGSYVTYVAPINSTSSYPTPRTCKYSIDAEFYPEGQRSGTAIIMGTTSDTVSKGCSYWLVKSGENFYFGLGQCNGSDNVPMELGHRYRLAAAKQDSISTTYNSTAYFDFHLEDVDSGRKFISAGYTGRNSSAQSIPALLGGGSYRYSGCDCTAGTGLYSPHMKVYNARFFNAGTARSFDLYPCIDSDGRAAFYDAVSGKLCYGRKYSKCWNTGAKDNYTILAVADDVEDSKLARLNDGTIEFCTEATAEVGAQVSIDGESWSSTLEIWTARDAEPMTIYCRRDPAYPSANCLGWSAAAGDFEFTEETTGEWQCELTFVAGRAHRFVAKAMVESDHPEVGEEILKGGDFEEGDVAEMWFGRTLRAASSDTTYVNASMSKDLVGAYVWGFDASAAGNKGRPVGQKIMLTPGTYSFFENCAIPAKKTTGYAAKAKVQVFESNNTSPVYTYTSGAISAYTTASSISRTFNVYQTGEYDLRLSSAADNLGYSALWVDNVSLKRTSPDSGLEVVGELDSETCAFTDGAGMPNYGDFAFADAASHVFEAPTDPVALGKYQVKVNGYRVDTWDGESWVPGEVQAGTSYEHTQVGDAKTRLVWIWEYVMSTISIPVVANVTVTAKIGDTPLTPTSGTDYTVKMGEEISLVATPAENYEYSVEPIGWTMDETTGQIFRTLTADGAQIDVVVTPPTQKGHVVKMITVEFNPSTLATYVATVGGIELDNNSLPEGTMIDLLVMPNEHYEYAAAPEGWTPNDDGTITCSVETKGDEQDKMVIGIPDPTHIMVKLEVVPLTNTEFELLVDGAPVQPGTVVLEGTEVTITITPQGIYEYSAAPSEEWTKNLDGSITKSFGVMADTGVIVVPTENFRKQQVALSFVARGVTYVATNLVKNVQVKNGSKVDVDAKIAIFANPYSNEYVFGAELPEGWVFGEGGAVVGEVTAAASIEIPIAAWTPTDGELIENGGFEFFDESERKVLNGFPDSFAGPWTCYLHSTWAAYNCVGLWKSGEGPTGWTVNGKAHSGTYAAGDYSTNGSGLAQKNYLSVIFVTPSNSRSSSQYVLGVYAKALRYDSSASATSLIVEIKQGDKVIQTIGDWTPTSTWENYTTTVSGLSKDTTYALNFRLRDQSTSFAIDDVSLKMVQKKGLAIMFY